MTSGIWAVALFCTEVPQLLMKIGMTNAGSSSHPLLAAARNTYVVDGFAAYGIGAVLWVKVLSRTMLSWLVLGERLQAGRIAGIA
jgi:hypothetical protein